MAKQPINIDAQLVIEDNALHFSTTDGGKVYDIVQPISQERLERLKIALGLNKK